METSHEKVVTSNESYLPIEDCQDQIQGSARSPNSEHEPVDFRFSLGPADADTDLIQRGKWLSRLQCIYDLFELGHIEDAGRDDGDYLFD